MKLPVMDGWIVLDRLKHHPETRHIPVHIVSAGDGRQNALKAGAVAFLEKPISKEGLETPSARSATSSTAVSSGCSWSRTTSHSGRRSSS